MKGHYRWNAETNSWESLRKEAPKVDAPFVHQDEMEPMQSMADCKFYTSKSKYRQSIKELGFIEVGNDVDGFKPKNPFETREYEEKLKEDLTRSWYEVRDGFAPLSELDRERCKEVNKHNERYTYDRRERDRDGKPRE